MLSSQVVCQYHLLIFFSYAPGMAPMRMDEGLENKPRRANNPDGIIARAGQGGKGIVAAGHLQMPDPMSPPAHIPPRRQTSRHYSRDASPDPLDEPPVGSLGEAAPPLTANDHAGKGRNWHSSTSVQFLNIFLVPQMLFVPHISESVLQTSCWLAR